jgi:enoyl-CoA hydratase/carnithine racemase
MKVTQLPPSPMQEIIVEREPPLAWVTLNRPAKRNAVTSAMWQRLPQLASELGGDGQVRVIILQGAGGAFSAGADIEQMRAGLTDAAAMRVMQAAVQTGQLAWANLDRPTIAAIDGPCTGGGCGLALACDLRLATPNSVFAVPPAKLGLVYSLADSRRLTNLVGPARAKHILFTGEQLTAEEALAAGLINRIVAQHELTAAARQLARTIANNAQNSVRAAKHIVNAIAAGQDTEDAVSLRFYNESFASPEFREGANAFLGKRPPKF